MKEGFFLRLIGAAPRKAQTQTLSKKIRGISFEKQFICRVHSSKLCVIWLSWSDKNYMRTCVELGRRVNEKCFHKEERQDKGVERDRRERRGDSAGQGWSHLDLSQTDTCEGKIVVLMKVAEVCFRENQWTVLFLLNGLIMENDSLNYISGRKHRMNIDDGVCRFSHKNFVSLFYARLKW